MSSRVLLVDDEAPFARAMAISLRAHGYEMEVATSGGAALAAAPRFHPDIVVLDLGLPDMDGVDVVGGLRAWSSVPVIVLSARHDDRAKVDALDAGADDYVTKPFSMDELLARLRATLRRSAPAPEEPVVSTRDFAVDLAAKRATVGGGPVHLTPTEWHIVELLVRNAGKLVPRAQLLREVWGPQYETETDYPRGYIASIRRKLEPDPSRPRYFITEAGMGYRFDGDPP